MATTPKRPTTRRAKPAGQPRRRTAAVSKSTAAASARSAQAKKEPRDSHGRFKTSHRTRNIALGIGGTIIALGAGIGTALWRGWVKLPQGPWTSGEDGHAAPDLSPDAPKPGTRRAPQALRPDPVAVPDKDELNGLRPATGPGPDKGWS